MDLKQLRYFARIAEFGSFTRAAAELRVAQSALSYQVGELEAELGVVLLNRHSRGVSLTEAGASVLERAHRVGVEPGPADRPARRVRGRLAAADVHRPR